MDTLNDMMTDLLIDQDGRLQFEARDGGKEFAIQANKAERIIAKGDEAYENQN